MRTLDEIRKEFPELERIVHLNSAALSLMPECSKKAMSDALVDREYTTEKRSAIREGRDREARKNIGRMINAPVDNLCLTANTSDGLNILAQGLDLRPGDNIVLSELEFVGNVVPWLNLEKKGVIVKKTKAEYGSDPTEKIIAAVDDKTKIVTLSYVGWIDGFRSNLTEIGNFCRDKDVIFVVDGIQGIGTMELDVKASHISFLACGGQKWLLSPNGTGFLYIADDLLPRIDQKYLGYLSIDNCADNAFDFVLNIKKDATRFLTGSYNDKGIAAMERSVSLILDAGIRNIQEHVIGLNIHAGERLVKKGYRLIGNRDPEHMSGILSFYGNSTRDVYEGLIQKGIIVSLRNGWIRAAFHLYNNQEDVDKLMSAL